jgi:hypothetical protein
MLRANCKTSRTETKSRDDHFSPMFWSMCRVLNGAAFVDGLHKTSVLKGSHLSQEEVQMELRNWLRTRVALMLMVLMATRVARRSTSATPGSPLMACE